MRLKINGRQLEKLLIGEQILHVGSIWNVSANMKYSELG